MYRLLPFITALGLVLSFTAPARAEQRPVVVELFTSQGCSSCPPADAMFDELQTRDGIIAIALHVDYWDYIGWVDEFGDPAHAARQRAYAQAGGRKSIYTPQMLVNGQTDIVGAKPMALGKAIAEHMAQDLKVALEINRTGDTVSVAARALAGGLGPMEVQLLRLIPSATTVIARGENRGRTIEYTNIAHGLRVIGSWNGQGPLALSAQVSGDDPVVVLVQMKGAGPIVAAARID